MDFKYEYFEKAALLEKSLKWKELLEHCTRWSEQEPDNFLPWSSIGLSYRHLEQPEEAVEAYEIGIGLAPEQPVQFFTVTFSAGPLWNGLGLAYSALNKVDDAIEAFTQAARIDSHEAKAWENLGVAYTHKGNAVKALDAFKRASFLNPADTNVLKKIGLVYASIGQQDGVAVVHKMLLQHSASVASDFMKQATALLKDRQNTK